MRSLTVLALLLLLISLASAGNVVKQSINMAGSGQVSQSAANAAVVSGNNNYITQGVTQAARGSQITQSGANAVVVVGNNNRVSQGVNQQASGSQITQSGSNALAVLGNNNYADQQVAQGAYGQNIFQNGWNTGSITGNNSVLIQGMLAYAQTYANKTNQTLGNTAYMTGSYNQVNQQAAGIVVAGRSSSPVTQTGSNFGQSIDKNYNQYDQNMNFKTRAGPGANVMQYGTNEVRIGPT
ncbi:MAG: hypothetical protein ACE14P_11675 [Methanotrichaceae archaeon]